LTILWLQARRSSAVNPGSIWGQSGFILHRTTLVSPSCSRFHATALSAAEWPPAAAAPCAEWAPAAAGGAPNTREACDGSASSASTAVSDTRRNVVRAPTCRQGLTLVHFSLQRKHFLWDSLGGFSDKNGSGRVDKCTWCAPPPGARTPGGRVAENKHCNRDRSMTRRQGECSYRRAAQDRRSRRFDVGGVLVLMTPPALVGAPSSRSTASCSSTTQEGHSQQTLQPISELDLPGVCRANECSYRCAEVEEEKEDIQRRWSACSQHPPYHVAHLRAH